MDETCQPKRLVAWLILLFGLIAAAELWMYFHQDGPPLSDFFGIWSWSRFVATEGTSALYDPAALHRFQQALDPTYTDEHYPFLYPPTYLLFIWPLAYLPFDAARMLWSAMTLAAYLLTIAGLRWRPKLIAAATVAPATVFCLICGQNGLLTAALMIGGLRAAPARPLLGGVLLGLLTYKPHLAFLIPVALIAAGLWRALLVAAATASLCIVFSGLAFGFDLWPGWLGAQRASWATIDTFIGAHLGMIPTVSAALRQLGCSPGTVLIGQFVATAAASLSIWIAGRRGLLLMVMPVAALLATPYAFLYDLPIVSSAALLAIAERYRSPLAVALCGSSLLLPQLMFNLQGAAVPMAAPILVLLLLWLLALRPAQQIVPATA